VITGKPLGGAVQRNKIKRRITSAVRSELKNLSEPIYGVFRMRQSALGCDWQDLEASVAEAFSRTSK
jgi:ribonuclease P protein component